MTGRAAQFFCVLGIVASSEAQTIATPSYAPATEIATPFGSLIVDGVEIGDRFPPGCRTSARDCSPAKPGNKVLMVWLKAKGDAEEASRGLMNLSNVYVKSDDDRRTDNFSGGMMNLRLFVAFTPPVTDKAFVLHWDNNPPISLDLLPPRSTVPRLASSPRAKEAPAPSRPAGQAIRLSNGMVLRIVAPPIADGLTWADGKRQQLLRGLEVTLAFRNAGSAAITHVLTTHIDDDCDVRVWYVPLNGGTTELQTPQAQELVGGTGYRTTMASGGIAVAGGCIDNNPVSIYDTRGNHIGLVIGLCTRAKETDQLRFLFPRPRAPSRAVLEVVRCGGCPAGGFAVDLGERRP